MEFNICDGLCDRVYSACDGVNIMVPDSLTLRRRAQVQDSCVPTGKCAHRSAGQAACEVAVQGIPAVEGTAGTQTGCQFSCRAGYFEDAGECRVCSEVTGAATVTCTGAGSSTPTSASDGYYLIAGQTPTVAACTGVPRAVTVTCTAADNSVATSCTPDFVVEGGQCVCGAGSFEVDGSCSGQCSEVTGAATVTCTEGGNSRAVCLDGFYNTDNSAAGFSDTCSPVECKSGAADSLWSDEQCTLEFTGSAATCHTVVPAHRAVRPVTAVAEVRTGCRWEQGTCSEPRCDVAFSHGDAHSCPDGCTYTREGEVRATLAFNLDFTGLNVGDLTAAIKPELASKLGVDVSRIDIRGVYAGSVVVDFAVLPDSGGRPFSATTISTAFQFAGESFQFGGETIVTLAPARDVSVSVSPTLQSARDDALAELALVTSMPVEQQFCVRSYLGPGRTGVRVRNASNLPENATCYAATHEQMGTDPDYTTDPVELLRLHATALMDFCVTVVLIVFYIRFGQQTAADIQDHDDDMTTMGDYTVQIVPDTIPVDTTKAELKRWVEARFGEGCIAQDQIVDGQPWHGITMLYDNDEVIKVRQKYGKLQDTSDAFEARYNYHVAMAKSASGGRKKSHEKQAASWKKKVEAKDTEMLKVQEVIKEHERKAALPPE